MFGNRSRQNRPRRPSDQLSGAGIYILILGGIMFALPTYFHQSWLLTSWLGSMQAPVGLGLIVVGGVLTVSGLVRGAAGKADAEPPPTLDPSIAPPPPGPVATEFGPSRGLSGAAAPSASTPAASTPAAPLGAGIDAPPPPLEPLYRPPTSLEDLGPSGPGGPTGPTGPTAPG